MTAERIQKEEENKMAAILVSSVMFVPAIVGLCVAMAGSEKKAA